MKIGKKFVLFSITMISIVVSASRYYIVKQNFLQSINTASKQNTNQYDLEKYMVEASMLKSIQNGEEVNDEKVMELLKALYTYMGKDAGLVAFYREGEDQPRYSNIEGIEQFDMTSILQQEADTYSIRTIGDSHYMIFSSEWNIDNKKMYIINAYDINHLYEEKNRQMSMILFTDIAILLVSSMVILVFSMYLTNPIRKLNKASKKIASGQFQERAHINSKDEIGELATSFNTMAEQIENKINELHLQVQQKNDFINGFTHELKTPMTAMMGYADLLRLKRCDEDLSKKALNYIYSETKRLERLSFKLMKLMSLTEERIEMFPISMTHFFNRIVKIEKEQLGDITIELEVEIATVMGDEELLEVVVRNLIENAKNAEPKDQKIIVKGETIEQQRYRISVTDKGKGIPKEQIGRVTEDFYMVDQSRSRKHGGSGIGLSLVKKILQLHQSNLFIESEEHRGTTVYFELKEIKDENQK